MVKNENGKLWVNRIISMILAGGVMFLIMNYGVANKLREELDSTKYEATRLLDDAKAFFENGNYAKAQGTLDTLFEKRPGSDAAAEGKKLSAQMETVKAGLNTKWDAAVVKIREEWAITMAAKLREDFKKEGEELEKNMEGLLETEWDKMKDSIRKEWEKEK